ncbi:MAG: beta-ketoacyl-ACP synthase III [Pseudomonadota bacterium]
MTQFARIAGTGSYLPEQVWTNHDLAQKVDTSDEWIRTRTGILQRHIAAEHETTADLAEQAACRALQAADRAATDIDLILVATTTPDQIFPSTACLLQRRLGNYGCPAFDLQAACSGFIYALSVADKFIRSGSHRCVLVVGAETFSRVIDWQDRATCVLFGDGAGAVILEAASAPGVQDVRLHADGRYAELLQVPGGVSQGIHLPDYAGPVGTTQMKGNEVFKLAVTTLQAMVGDILTANGLQQSDIDWLVPHQANIRIIQAIAKRLQLPMEQVVTTIAQHGNTSAASIPLALDVAIRDGRIQRGQRLLLEAFGGGFTWGSALLTY